MDDIFKAYGNEVAKLSGSSSTTELSYYPAIKTLLARMLDDETLPFEVRASTSESRAGGGHDLPDLALYDGNGEYLVDRARLKNLPQLNKRDGNWFRSLLRAVSMIGLPWTSYSLQNSRA